MTGKKLLSVGIAGCGAAVALYYRPALQILERQQEVCVTTLFDPEPHRAKEIGRVFQQAVCARDFEEMLQQKLDLIILASPPRYHAEQAIRALQSGRPILCEKPLAPTVAECEEMISTASVHDQLLAVGLSRRYMAATSAIRDLLSRAIIGELESFYCFEGGPFQWPARSTHYFDKSIGGVLLDLGVHTMDLLIWWLGRPVEIAYEDDAIGGVEANCRIRISYRGFRGEVRLSRDWPRPNTYVFRGSKGWITWPVNEADRVQIGLHNSPYILDASLQKLSEKSNAPAIASPADNFHQSYVTQIRNVICALAGEEMLAVSAQDALESIKVIEHCYKNRTLLPMSWMNPRELQRARTLSGSTV